MYFACTEAGVAFVTQARKKPSFSKQQSAQADEIRDLGFRTKDYGARTPDRTWKLLTPDVLHHLLELGHIIDDKGTTLTGDKALFH